MYGNSTEVYPDKLSVEAMTTSGPVSYQFELVDMYTYRAPVVQILNDPSVSVVYIYASYGATYNQYYIIGSEEMYRDGFDPSYNNPVPTPTYSLQ